MSNSSYKVALKDGTVAVIESKGGVEIHSLFDGMLNFIDKESGKCVAIFPIGTFTYIQMCGAVSVKDIKGLEEMGQDSKNCRSAEKADVANRASYRALYMRYKAKSETLAQEVAKLKGVIAVKDQEITALKSNDRSWVGAPTRQNHGDNFPFGDGVLPIRFMVMS